MKLLWFLAMMVAAEAGGLAGGVAPVVSELPLVEGAVEGSVVAPDGSVFVTGRFTEIDGVARPGLAKLTPGGLVDESFQPEVLFDNSGFLRLVGFRGPVMHVSGPPGMMVTADGTLLIPRPERLLAFGPAGGVDHRFDGVKDAPGGLTPLFEDEGRIFYIRFGEGPARLEARRADTLETIAVPGLEGVAQPVTGAVRGPEGKVWVLLGWASSMGPGVVRLEADLTIDPTIEPLVLDAGKNHEIRSVGDGGFCVESMNRYNFSMWPGTHPPTQRMTFSCFSADGESTGGWETDFSGAVATAYEEDGSLLVAKEGLLIRTGTDGSEAVLGDVDPAAVEVLADGRIQAGHLGRLLADGTPDPEWSMPVVRNPAAYEVVGTLGTGRVLLKMTWAGRSELLVVDEGLQETVDSARFAELPAFNSAAVAPDGKVVLVLREKHLFENGTETWILKVTADGTIDPGSPRYVPVLELSWLYGGVVPGDVGLRIETTESIDSVSAADDGGFLIGLANFGGEVASSRVVRVRADGSSDPAFAFEGSSYYARSPQGMSDGTFIYGNKVHSRNGRLKGDVPISNPYLAAELENGQAYLVASTGNDFSKLIRWHPDDGVDAGFSSPFVKGSFISRVEPVGSGKVVVSGTLLTAGGPHEMVRLHGDGRVDPFFRPALARKLLPLTAGAESVLVGPALLPATRTNREVPGRRFTTMAWLADHGRLVLAGDFTDLGDLPRSGIGVLELGGERAFAAWSEAWMPGLVADPERDSDGDGVSDFQEYATGTDPTKAGDAVGLEYADGVFRLPRDADAVGVKATFEVSADLEIWWERFSQRRTLPGAIEWRIFPGHVPRLFGRVVFEETAEDF